jgi:hypothetical protein
MRVQERAEGVRRRGDKTDRSVASGFASARLPIVTQVQDESRENVGYFRTIIWS